MMRNKWGTCPNIQVIIHFLRRHSEPLCVPGNHSGVMGQPHKSQQHRHRCLLRPLLWLGNTWTEGWTGQQAASSTTASESSSIKSNFLFLQAADSFSLCFMFVVPPVYTRGQCSRDTPHLKMGKFLQISCLIDFRRWLQCFGSFVV